MHVHVHVCVCELCPRLPQLEGPNKGDAEQGVAEWDKAPRRRGVNAAGREYARRLRRAAWAFLLAFVKAACAVVVMVLVIIKQVTCMGPAVVLFCQSLHTCVAGRLSRAGLATVL